MNLALFASPPASACTLETQGSEGPDRITRTTYDAAGQRLQLREGVGTGDEGTEATWAYSPNGQVTQIIDGNGNRATLGYDGHGRQDRWTFPSATRAPAFNDATPATALASAGSANAADYEEYGHDAVGNRTSLRKRDGSLLTYQYDALNRMIVKIVPERAGLDPSHTRDVHYGYDVRNLQLYARFDSQSGPGVTNSYDGFGRLTSSSTNMSGTSRTLAYQYDVNSNRTRITHPDGIYFTATYDALGRQTWIHEQGIFGRVVAGYNPYGSFAGTSRSNGTLTNYGYDAVQRPNAYYHDLGGTAADGLWLFARNPAGQIASTTRENDSYAWTGHYAVSRAYTTDGLNRYSAAGSATFGYDLNGNLTSDGTRTYTYDVENRLVGASGGLALAYDPLGRLFSLTHGGSTTNFLYDGDALVAEYNNSAMTRRYVHWTGADIPLLSYADTDLSQLSQLHADERGSIIAITDANGAATINAYDEYGIPGAGNTGRFQYTGQAWLPELGMYYYKARVYSPSLGRFLQTDPVGYEGGINLYAYVGNDPVNATDSTGEKTDIPTCGSRVGISASCSGETILGLTGSSDRRRPVRPSTNDQDGEVEQGENAEGERVQLACAGPLIVPCGYGVVEGLTVLFGLFVVTDTAPRPLLSQSDGQDPPGPERPPGVPRNWQPEGPNRQGSHKFVDPTNRHNYVRIRPDGTITQVRHGRAYDAQGRPVDQNSPAAHYPRSRFRFRH